MTLRNILGFVRSEQRGARTRTLINAAGMALGVAVLVTVVGMGVGTRRAVLDALVGELPIHMVEVVPQSVDLGLIKLDAGKLFGGPQLDAAVVERLNALPGVEAVYPKLQLRLPLGARGGKRLFGKALYTDLFVTGMPPALVPADIRSDFQAGGEVVPVVISEQLIEVYNSSVASALGTPKMTAETLQGFRFDLLIGRSLMLGHQGARTKGSEPAVIVGTSPHALRLGASVPLATARRLLDKYAQQPEARRPYASVVVEARHPERLPDLTRRIQNMGLAVDDTAARTADLLTATTAIASLVGLAIVALAALSIAHTFFAVLSERRRELAILRAVGARRVDVLTVVLMHAAWLGTVGGASGVIAGRAAAWALDAAAGRWLPDFPFKPETFFAFPAWLYASAVLLAVLASVVGAAWPAWRASRVSVARVLSAS